MAEWMPLRVTTADAMRSGVTGSGFAGGFSALTYMSSSILASIRSRRQTLRGRGFHGESHGKVVPPSLGSMHPEQIRRMTEGVVIHINEQTFEERMDARYASRHQSRHSPGLVAVQEIVAHRSEERRVGQES